MPGRPRQNVRLRMMVINSPGGGSRELFGSQDKSGALVSGVRRPEGSEVFECEVQVARSSTGAQVNFLGPLTHGTPTNRHLYLSHRMRGTGSTWIKRIKVPLSSITWTMIDGARDGVLETDVDGRRSGTVPATWRVAPPPSGE